MPEFEYRPLEADPAMVNARLHAVRTDLVEDQTLTHFLLSKQREVRLQAEMLGCRGSRDFLPLGIELYGAVSPTLLSDARALLDRIAAPPADAGPWLDANAFADRAREELDPYRVKHGDVEANVEICEDSSGLMVSHGEVLIVRRSAYLKPAWTRSCTTRSALMS